jgi:hypothetical protein
MSSIQLGSGQITVFAVIPKLVSPCCHTRTLFRVGSQLSDAFVKIELRDEH